MRTKMYFMEKYIAEAGTILPTSSQEIRSFKKIGRPNFDALIKVGRPNV